MECGSAQLELATDQTNDDSTRLKQERIESQHGQETHTAEGQKEADRKGETGAN